MVSPAGNSPGNSPAGACRGTSGRPASSGAAVGSGASWPLASRNVAKGAMENQDFGNIYYLSLILLMVNIIYIMVYVIINYDDAI